MNRIEMIATLEAVLYKMVDPPETGNMKDHWIKIHAVLLSLKQEEEQLESTLKSAAFRSFNKSREKK